MCIRDSPYLQRQPQLLGSLQRLQHDWEELQRIRRHSEQQPPAPCTAEEYAALQQRLTQAEQQCARLDDELRTSQAQNQDIATERARWEEELSLIHI